MGKGVRRGLTPARVLDEAQAIVDGGGADALTMRALAAALGAAPMAVYNHYRDREAILDALAERVFAAISAEAQNIPERGANWRRRLRSIIFSAQRFAGDHSHLYRLAMTRPNKPPAAFQITVQALATLRSAGLTDKEALQAYHAFVLMLQGYPLWQESYVSHAEVLSGEDGCIAPALDAASQFAASVEWLLRSIARSGKRKSPATRRGSRKDSEAVSSGKSLV
jgi:AcrR family transcriptional regulator